MSKTRLHALNNLSTIAVKDDLYFGRLLFLAGSFMAGKYILNFLDFKTSFVPDLRKYESYFTNYDSGKWKAGSGGASFKYIDEKGKSFSLAVSEDSRFGFVLQYEIRDENINKPIGSWLSVADFNKLNEIVESEDKIPVPKGSYLSAAEAWTVVRHFMTMPSVRNTNISWISVFKIKWR